MRKMSPKSNNVVTISEMREKFSWSKQSNAYQLEIEVFMRDTGLSNDDPISFITEEKVNQWVNVMRERGLKPASISHYLGCFRVFTNWCDLGLKIRVPRYNEEQLRFYTDDEVAKLLSNKKKDFASRRTYTVIAFILATGARASTIVNIKVEDIDFKHREVYYRHLKNKKTAIIPLPENLMTILKEYLNEWDINEYLFPDQFGRQLTVSALRQSINRYCKRCGVKPKSIHALRHTFARLYIKNGGDSFTLMRFLTHSDVSMSQKYVHLFSDDLRVASNTYIPLGKLLPERLRSVQRRF